MIPNERIRITEQSPDRLVFQLGPRNARFGSSFGALLFAAMLIPASSSILEADWVLFNHELGAISLLALLPLVALSGLCIMSAMNASDTTVTFDVPTDRIEVVATNRLGSTAKTQAISNLKRVYEFHDDGSTLLAFDFEQVRGKRWRRDLPALSADLETIQRVNKWVERARSRQ